MIQIRQAIESIRPSILGVKKAKIQSFAKLGIGESNLNYVFAIENKNFICRICISNESNKSKKEYTSLKAIEPLGIAPKAYYLHKADKTYPKDFIILEFLEGKPFRKKKRDYTKVQVTQLSNLMAELHSRHSSNFKKDDYSYKQNLKRGLEYIRGINKYTKQKYETQLKAFHKQISLQMPKTEKHYFGIVHDDICPQNTIETGTGLKFIDWESCKLSDPAKDISHVLIDLCIRGRMLDIFMRQYQKRRRDKSILSRAKTYAILMRYHYYLWEILRAYEIKNEELSKEYLKKNTAEQHLREARHQYRQLRKLVRLPEKPPITKLI